jgi:hypothetical protein
MTRKNPFPALIASKEAELKTCDHRSRERLRYELRCLKTANELRRRIRAQKRAA